jgi:transcriptional regulator with XRE-family HTH domain
MSDLRERLREEFQDSETRHAYTESFLNSSIAAQIRLLRKARRMTQRDLARMIGTKQPGVSRFESADYDGWSIPTLQGIARAFDVTLSVRFESFGDSLRHIERYGDESLVPPAFPADPAFHARNGSGAKVIHAPFQWVSGETEARTLAEDSTTRKILRRRRHG